MTVGWRIWLTRAMAVVQLALVLYVLAYVWETQDATKMEQEVHPREVVDVFHMTASKCLNSVSLFSGPDYFGVDMDTPARQYLSFQEGQMIWFLLKKSILPTSPFYRRMLDSIGKKQDAQRMLEGTSDGLLNFLYDVGRSPAISLQNWSGCAVGELQASPLLPWTKHLDFVVLSSSDSMCAGGLPFIANLNPDMLIILPAGADNDVARFGGYSRKPNLLVLEPGVHAVADGLWFVVLNAGGASQNKCELDIVVERQKGGLALFSGSALNSPSSSVASVEDALAREVTLYVGDTGWLVGYDMSEFQAEVARLQAEHPNLTIIPNGRTSMVAHSVLEAMLGLHYQQGRLGTRVRL